MEILLPAAKIAAAAYVGLCLLVYATQASYLYYPEKLIQLTPAVAGMPYESITLPTADGESLGAWYVPANPATARDRSLIFCHGNAGNIGDRVGSIRTFHDLELAVLIFDYRGYGTSSGKPSEAGTYADAMAAWRYLADERGVTPNRVLIFGRSLGGAIAAQLAEAITPGALVLESSFTSVPDMAKRLFPYLPARLLTRYRYNTVERLARINCPTLIAHSRQDGTIPFEHGQRLFAAAREPRTFVEFSGDHNSGGMDADTAYHAAFEVFLNRLDEIAR
ncbi:MAG: alpha/beta hydrolase [Verrucomicrobia bacterium]|nr:alpha/beta hydrolase [Verrucomicrobiota bacterium]